MTSSINILELATKILPPELNTDRLMSLAEDGTLRTILSALADESTAREIFAVAQGSGTLRHYASVQLTSNGKTGREWLAYFGDAVSDRTKELLLSRHFVPTKNNRYLVDFVPGRPDQNWAKSLDSLQLGHARKKPVTVSMELACLIAERMHKRSNPFHHYHDTDIMVAHTPTVPETHMADSDDFWLIAKCRGSKRLTSFRKPAASNGYLYALCTEAMPA